MTSNTFIAKPKDIQRTWYVVDASGKRLGILASAVAKTLTGKNKPMYTPNIDTGDFVVVVNAEKIEIAGTKADKKVYRRHTQFPGGLREVGYHEMQAKHPERIIEIAVRACCPRTNWARQCTPN